MDLMACGHKSNKPSRVPTQLLGGLFGPFALLQPSSNLALWSFGASAPLASWTPLLWGILSRP